MRRFYWHPSAEEHYKDEHFKHLTDSSYHSEVAFAIDKLLEAVETIIQKKWWCKKTKSDFEKRLGAYLVLFQDLRNEPMIDILVCAIEFFLSPNLSRYNAFKTCFFHYYDKLRSHQRNIWYFLLNGVALSNHADKLSEYFELYQWGDIKSLILQNGRISLLDFNNIAHIAYDQGELTWGDAFVKKYKRKLRGQTCHIDKSLILVACYRHYCMKEYAKVLKKLKGIISFPDVTYGIMKHMLILKSLFESDDLAAIDQQVISFKAYLKNQGAKERLGQDIMDLYLHFAALLQKAVFYPFGKSSKMVLLQELNTLNGKIAEEKWLRKIIESL